MDESNDNFMDDIEETQETQQQTQPTQQSSQHAGEDMNGHLWGYLQPCGSGLTRIDFWRITPRYKLGRSKELNDCVLPGPKISNQHCVITWEGENAANAVVIDKSSNGTFINGLKIGRDQTRVLREGNEIAFGTCMPQPGSLEDYRFIYRHTATAPPTTGLYAFYDIIDELGKGSFAVVMKAVCRKSGEYVAVKIIQERGVRSPGDQTAQPRKEVFNREISILEKLKHPNICELKEVFYQEDAKELNLVLELVEGGDLLDYILSKGGLTEAETQHITYQLCDALAYIHSQNVAHRDLKPENVLLTKDSPPKVKVADFGLAKTMCGTPSYLAPEVVSQQNNEGYDNLVDSWSVGVIVFSMLTNSSPFIEEEGQRDVRTRVIERTVDWNLLNSMNVSENVIDFVRNLMEEDPRQRMTLTNALHHPWLQSHVPVYGSTTHYPIANKILTDDYSMISAGADNEGSFRGSVNADFQNLHIAPSRTPAIPGAFLNGAGTNGLSRQPSRGVPLQRGSLLAKKAAEAGIPLPDPPAEMIANAAAQALRDEQAAGLDSNLKGVKKRVHSELTPLPEEAPMDAVMNEAGPSAMAVENIPASNDKEKTGPTPAAAKKGRGKGKAASASPTKVSARLAAKGAENEATPPTRRSTRPQKVARRT
ncbi:hypothetical protein H0H87_003016 [Tephrocybe sp. NHM501043]|nr:hypothetical protein H0H87_003016 [Tephrocybe sp. NHM501043]